MLIQGGGLESTRENAGLTRTAGMRPPPESPPLFPFLEALPFEADRGTSYSGGVERHQQSAMIRSQSCVDESRDFFLAEDRRKVKCSFRIGRFGHAPGFLENFAVEESQSCQSLRNRARRQLALLEQLGLIFTNVFWTQTIWRTLESF